MQMPNIRGVFVCVFPFLLSLALTTPAHAVGVTSNGDGVASGTTQLTISEISETLLSADIEGVHIIRKGDTVTLTCNAHGGEGSYKYSWAISKDGGKTFTDLGEESAETIDITGTSVGEFVIRCKVTDESCQTVYAFATVGVVDGTVKNPATGVKSANNERGAVSHGGIRATRSATAMPQLGQSFIWAVILFAGVALTLTGLALVSPIADTRKRH